MEYIKRTWAEVSLDNLAHNYTEIRKTLPAGCRFLGVVKADAYGHGAVPVSRALEELGAEYPIWRRRFRSAGAASGCRF